MLEKVIAVVGPITTVLAFPLVIIAGYHHTMFVQEWLEDHAPSAGFWRRQMLSVTVSGFFSKSVSERCRRRQRRVRIWTSAFFALLIMQALLLWL